MGARAAAHAVRGMTKAERKLVKAVKKLLSKYGHVQRRAPFHSHVRKKGRA